MKNANGQTSTGRLEYDRQYRKASRYKEWDDETWQLVKKRLDENSKVDTNPNEFTGSSCILWIGPINKSGYGKLSIHGVQYLAHILSCSIKCKRLRANDEVTRHLCSNKICINPEHLDFGSYTENAIDSVIHQTTKTKLTEKDVREIRKKYDGKDYNYEYFSIKYNVSKRTIRGVVKRETWKHI